MTMLIAIILILGAVALKWPKRFVFLGVLLTIFSDTLVLHTKIQQVSFVDEAFVLIALIVLPATRLLKRRSLRSIREFRWIFVVLVAGIVGALLHDVPWTVVALASALVLKWFLLSFSVAQVDWNPRDIAVGIAYASGVAVAIFAMGLANLLAPGWWTETFAAPGAADQRFGLGSLVGPFTHPSTFASITAFIAIGAAAYRGVVKRTAIASLFLISSMILSVLAFRRRLWVALGVGLSAVWLKGRSRSGFLLACVLLVPVLAVVGADFLGNVVSQLSRDYFTESAEFSTARTIMTLDALEIAAIEFPFGIGLGRFGSYTAALIYSPEYVARGYPAVFGLSPEGAGSGAFLTDTFWPSVLGETGWLGAVAFILVLVTALRRFVALSRESTALVRWLGVTGVAILLFFIVDSIASPAFTAVLASIPFALLGIAASLESTACDRETGLHNVVTLHSR